MILISFALARDVDIKVHDMKGVATGTVDVEVSGPAAAILRFTCLDDGNPPDALAGDRMYTAQAAGFPLENGTVTVRSGDRTWQGGFRFDAASDPVLLIGLEDRGFAAASTKEVMFVPQDKMAPGDPGAAATRQPPQTDGTSARKAPVRRGVPEGMWLGWALAALFLGGLGALVYAGAARTPRLPPLLGETLLATATRGRYQPVDNRTDLFLGPSPVAGGARIAEGRWTPAELSLAAMRVRGACRLVVTDPSLVDADGDAYEGLRSALSGVADLLWVESD